MTLSEILKRLEKIGYALTFNQKNALGKKYRYRTTPTAGYGGPTNYFNDKAQLERYIVQVEQVRQWQEVA